MCAVISSFIRRLFSSFVLACFVWTILFQTIAFADYKRAQPDPVPLKEQGNITFAHLNVGVQKIERSPSPTDKNGSTFDVDRGSSSPTAFVIPFGKTYKRTQELIDQAFSASQLHEETTVVEKGLTWTSYGIKLYRHNSGELIVSNDSILSDHSHPFHIYNYHGSTILEDSLPFDHLILSGKDVIQRGNRSLNSLSLCIDGTFVNENFLSVSTLLFNDTLHDPSASSHSTCFANEATFIASEETIFGIARPIFNRGNMHFEKDVILKEDILNNEDAKSIFNSSGKIKGTLKALSNHGTFRATEGFEDVRITQFLNVEDGKIQGNGRLTVGAKDHDAVNAGDIESSELTLHLEGDFYNRHRIHADDIFQTTGMGTFHQLGTLDGKKAFIDNTRFENEVTLERPDLDLVLGEHVTTFHNHHLDCNKKDITLKTRAFTLHKSISETPSLINSGVILTNTFDNSASAFTNEHQIETTAWTQRGTTFTNASNSTIDVKDTTHFDTTLLSNNGDVNLMGETSGNIQHLKNNGGMAFQKKTALTSDLIENAGILTVSEGEVTAKTIRNTKKMNLLNGSYTCERLENKTGEATIDQLSLTTDSPILEGKLTVNHFKATHERYKDMLIDGDVTLTSGGFKTSQLNIKGALTLGKGHYYIEVLKGDKDAKLLLQKGAHVKIGNVEYDGDIVSCVSLELNPFEEKLSLTAQVRDDHTQRQTAFNAIPSAKSADKPELEDTVYTKSKSITDTLSDYKRINPNKSCSLEELKSRLQSTIGTEITRLIHNADKQNAIDFQKTLPVLTQTDRLYGHFEIFRRTSKSARNIIQKITTDGMDILDSLKLYVPSFDTDFSIIHKYRHDLTRDMFMLWFKEVLEEHDEGFTPFKKLKPSILSTSAPSTANESYLTYHAPNSKPGGIEALLQNHNARQIAFNAIQISVPLKALSQGETVYTATQNILGILGRVSSKKITDPEWKNILQTIMGSEITSVVHSKEQQEAIRLETNLPVLTKDHTFYRHFETLRITAKLSRLLVQHVSTYGCTALNYVTSSAPDFEADADTMCLYSGIKRDMFMLWFKEIFEKHKKGFPETTASLTFLSHVNGKPVSIARLHQLKIKGGLILNTHGSSLENDKINHFLQTRKGMLDIVSKEIIINADVFSNREPLDLPYHLHFNTTMFKPKNTLTVKGMTLHASHAQIGSDNNHMVKVICDGTMDAHVENNVDVRFGILQSTKKGVLRSIRGNILVGARKNLDEKGKVLGAKENNDKAAVKVVKNGAIISSNEELILEALKGGILNSFGVLFGKTLLHYSAKKLENTSSEGTSDDVMLLDVDEFNHMILNEIYQYDTGRSGHDGTSQTITMPPAIIGSPFGGFITVGGGSIQVPNVSAINGQRAKAESSMLSAKGDIIINSKKAPAVFASHFASCGSILWCHTDGLFKEVPNGVAGIAALTAAQVIEIKSLALNDYFTSNSGNAGIGNGVIVPTLASAEGITLDFQNLNTLFEAAVSGQNIVMTAHGWQIVNAAGYRKPTKTAATLVDVERATDTLLTSSLTKKESDGTTKRYTRNMPGTHDSTHSIAVLPTKKQTPGGVPRSIFSNTQQSGFSPNQSRPNVVFDDATLEHLCMHGQLTFTGRINDKGAGFLTYLVQNGHKLSAAIQLMLEEGKRVDESVLLDLKEPALFQWPEDTDNGTIDILYALFSADMNMPYDGTSGNIQATGTQSSDRVEELNDGESQPTQNQADVEIIAGSGGVHRSGATIGGGGGGGVLVKTIDGGNITAESQTRRDYTHNGHADSIAVSDLMESTGNVTEDSDGHIFYQGAVDHEAGKGTSDPHKLILSGKDGVFGIETMLEQRTVEQINRRKVTGTRTETINRPVTQSFKSSGTTLVSSANSKVYLAAPTFDTPLGTIVDGKLGAELGEVQTTSTCEETSRKEGNGLTTQSKNRQHTKQKSRSSGATAKRGSVLVRSTEGDATTTNVQIDDLTLEAANGLAHILLGTNYFFEQEVITGKSKVYQSVSSSSERHDTFTESKIKQLAVTKSLETVVQSVQGRIPEFMQRIQNDGGKLTYDFVNEIHESTHFEHESLVPEAALVISLAAAIATYGACSWVGGYAAASAGMTTTAATASTATGLSATTGCIAATGSTTAALTTAGSITAGMITAGLNALTSQAIVTLASNKGDMDKTLKDLNKSDTFKSVAVAMSVAGLVGGGSLEHASLAQHLTHQAIRMSAQMGVESAIYGRTDGKAAALTAIASSLCGYLSNNIGNAYTKGDFGYFTHKFLHALSGAAGGAIIDGKDGAIAGAVGAAGVEVIVDFMSPTGGMANDPNRPHYTDEQIQHTKDAARFTVVLLGLAAGLNAKQLSVELTLATVAVENNFEQSSKNLKEGLKASAEDEEAELSLVGHLEKTTGDFGKHDALPPAESAQQNTTILTIGDTEFDVVSHVANHPGMKRRTLSLNSLYLHEQLEQAETDWKNATSILDKHFAFKTMQTRQNALMARNVKTTAVKAANYAVENPLHAAGYVAGGLLTVASTFPAATGVGLPGAAAMGSAGLALIELTNKDGKIQNGQDALDVASAAALGALPGVRQLKYMLPVAAAVGGYGFETDQEHLMWGSILTAGLGSAPRVIGWGINKFTAQQSITMQSANKMGSIDDIILNSSLRPPVNLNQPVRPAANLDRISVSHVLTEASEVNGIQGLAQQHIRGSGTVGMKPTTMSGSAESGLLNLTKPKTGLIEGANEASAAYKRVQANMASPASVASGGLHAQAVQPKIPAELRSYIREVEAKSGLTVHPKQRELLAQDLRETSYPRFEKTDPAYKAHKAVYDNPKVKTDLKAEWSRETGQAWPKHPVDMKNPDGTLHRFAGKDYQLHHINPQELGGKHAWWNSHPVHVEDHTYSGGIHSGVIKNIVKDALK
jgi:hypothetical protein